MAESSLMPRHERKSGHPRMIGPWKIGRTLGEGMSGVVRIARHSKTGQYAAVKIASKVQLQQSRRSVNNADTDAERSMLFLEREIVVMKLVDHPNIMHLYDVWETSGELYLILEYVEGGELFDYIADRKRLPTDEALDLFQQLIGAMEYLQSLKIAHRDLKPENLLLDKNKILKVADFGMAAWLGDNGLQQTACGSPHYASPEVIANLPYDGAISDIWSCGVILYALLTGRLPFDDEDTIALLKKVSSGVYTMPTDIDPRAQHLLTKMLEKDVSKRIRIQDIKKHPWVLSQPRRHPEHPAPSFDEIARPLKKSSDIDTDVFANLRTLWHNASETTLMQNLLSEKQTWEKTVYALLLRYRIRCQENYQEELERAKSERRAERKKLKAQRGATQASRPTTPSAIPPRPAPPTPNRATAHRGGTRPAPQVKRNGVTDATYLTPGLTTPRKGSKQQPILPTSPKSPIWQALDVTPPKDVPELQDEKVQTYFQQIMDHLNMMQHLPGYLTPHTTSSTPGSSVIRSVQPGQTPRLTTPVIQQKGGNGGLGLSNDNKENQIKALLTKKSSLRKAKEIYDRNPNANHEKRVQIILPPIVDRLRRVSGTSTVSSPPESPDLSLSSASSFSISSAPRKSWFTNLFKFKPAAFSMASVLDEAASRNAARRLLIEAGVHVVTMHANDSRSTFLSCVLEEVRDPAGVMAVTKSVKFRVEFHPLRSAGGASPHIVETENGEQQNYQVMVEMVLEKGAITTFKLIHQRLRKEWDFVEDVPATPRTPHLLHTDIRSPVRQGHLVAQSC